MLTPLIATLLMFAPAQGPGTACPIMGSPAKADGPAVEYAGAKYTFCCAGCDAKFAKEPVSALKSDDIKGKTVGVFLFDPVTGKRIDAKAAKASTEFNGLRYLFASTANKAEFDKDMKKYGTIPAKESLACPMTGEVVETYSKASAYMDSEGVRYYLCCAGCEAPFAKDMRGNAKKVAGKVTAPSTHAVKGN